MKSDWGDKRDIKDDGNDKQSDCEDKLTARENYAKQKVTYDKKYTLGMSGHFATERSSVATLRAGPGGGFRGTAIRGARWGPADEKPKRGAFDSKGLASQACGGDSPTITPGC